MPCVVGMDYRTLWIIIQYLRPFCYWIDQIHATVFYDVPFFLAHSRQQFSPLRPFSARSIRFPILIQRFL